jgi:LAO/AO transport system kinase
MWQDLLSKIQHGDTRAIARAISLVENEHAGYENFLQSITPKNDTPVIGITGPPGAGKSTLVDALIRLMVNGGKKVAVLCVDPSSPFNMGAILGDRIRMSEWYNHSSVFIRSLATRGHMGGLNHKIIELTELLRSSDFDLIIVETVGVGQSEIEIAGLADTTVVVVVPEAGDEIQTMKAGLMEIADIFVVNKSDRPDADLFVKNLRTMLAPAFHEANEIPVIKTIAHNREGIEDLYAAIRNDLQRNKANGRKVWLLTEKLYQLIQAERMRPISKSVLKNAVGKKMHDKDFNLYRLASQLGKS